METESYVTEFLGHYKEKDYRRAYDVFLEHGDDLVVRVGRDELVQIFTEFINSGMASEAHELYQSAVRVNRNDLVEGIEMEMALLDLGSAKRRMITKRSKMN